MKTFSRLVPVVGLVLLFANQAHADLLPNTPGPDPNNVGPPPGWILDLAGNPVPTSYTQYSVNFTATAASTNLSFALRHDPGFFALDDVAVNDITTPGPNIVLNGGFEGGVLGSNTPDNWTYLNTFGAAFSGIVENGTQGTLTAHSGSQFYYDGATQAYDGITQALATTIGDTYKVTFWLNQQDSTGFGSGTFQQLSTNGHNTDSDTDGNGVDVLVYAGAIPTLTPEPASFALVGSGLALLGVFARRRRKAKVA